MPHTPEKRKAYVEANRDRMHAMTKNWIAANKDRFRELQRAYRERHKDRMTARDRLNTAVKSGKITRPKNCEHCQASSRLEGHHHNGYSPEHWLDVLWLCRPCHTAAEKLCRS